MLKISTIKFGLMLLMVLTILFGPSLCAAQDLVAVKKKNLEEINQQLEEKRKELEHYKQDEDRISGEISELKKQEKKDGARQRELESRLVSAKAKSAESAQKYNSLEKTRKSLASDFHGEIAVYALLKDFYYPYFGNLEISKSIFLKYAVIEKHALIAKLKGESIKVNKDLQTLARRGQELKASKILLEKQRSAQKNAVKGKFNELERSREQQAQLSREVDDLQNAAKGLSRLVKKLEKQSPYRRETGSKDLPLPKHSLPWPSKGKVISRFGREEVPALKTWIVREGIRIRTEPDTQVFAVMSGKVLYAGPFRTYGNVVIVDHEKGFFTIYGLLSSMSASKGDAVFTGTALGLSGRDTQGVGPEKGGGDGAVYFEIRKGEQALDPMVWLQD
ncbi:MAG: peptidoglycan DD-metalloendopeptidase family protein [Elusimicrobia bacterium]|nr:peptidoglycan DD-metalloendopeptidase family protein [Elusimicrobiota bacterium]